MLLAVFFVYTISDRFSSVLLDVYNNFVSLGGEECLHSVSLYFSPWATKHPLVLMWLFKLLSRVQLFMTPWMGSMPGFPDLHRLPEFAQTHVHWVGDAIQPSPLSPPFSSCPQSFPASGSFPMSQIFASGGQRIGALASASVLPMNIQDWYPLGWTGLISLQSKGLLSPPTPQHQFFGAQTSLQTSTGLYAKTICLAIVAMSNCCKAFETLALNFWTSCGQHTIWGLRKRSKNRTRGQGAGCFLVPVVFSARQGLH